MPDSNSTPEKRPRRKRSETWKSIKKNFDEDTKWIAHVLLDLTVLFDASEYVVIFTWLNGASREVAGKGYLRCTSPENLVWETEQGGVIQPVITSHDHNAIQGQLYSWLTQFRTNVTTFSIIDRVYDPQKGRMVDEKQTQVWTSQNLFPLLREEIIAWVQAMTISFSSLSDLMQTEVPVSEFDQYDLQVFRKERKQALEKGKRYESMARLAIQRRDRESKLALERKLAEKISQDLPPVIGPGPSPQTESPLPVLTISFEMPSLSFQDTTFPVPNLQNFFLRERAALWWVSNQSDDLLCLSQCRVQRLDYQIRTALRVLGPLRGRALLSDEVGLGKTIEAGLIIKELFTRGMVKKFLILTVPSLVDQWEEELADKFSLATVTTNQPGARNDPQKFWTENSGIVASLHTLKQPAQLEIALQVKWDILVVDEAHYLRNRESQAWQAVNALPRQFLLLLTATPVQNSLEELYNLVTLLQPGQLPSPREFRARFIDPKRPRQPREPEELRRLLGQVMIRNTRANAGLKLPPRRAETVLFEPDEMEGSFWKKWDGEFRAQLARLNPSQSSLWGRLLLQTAGSSPAAWRAALAKFPDAASARAWREQSPLESSWLKKCELIPPLTRVEGGAVIFTQFLETQAALSEYLRGSRVETFVVNGSTPAAQRQPITEEFRKRGGALILTQSGTEGRNLQFSRHLVNFDLPWNPMEIEQRIGRLHRLGQQHPVRIYNFVQAGTLQEHLLQILQEKLNLFELVVGETGLVLGERFASDEFAEEVFRRWRENEGRVAEALAGLGDELATARDTYSEIKKLDETLFAKDYESL